MKELWVDEIPIIRDVNTTESKKLFGTLKQKTKGSFNEASNWLNSQKNKPALNLIKAAFDKKKKGTGCAPEYLGNMD